MLDLMIGHKKINWYGEWSIFIVKSKLFQRKKLESKSESQLSLNETEDISDDHIIDYDDSNHYMKTFLSKYKNSAS